MDRPSCTWSIQFHSGYFSFRDGDDVVRVGGDRVSVPLWIFHLLRRLAIAVALTCHDLIRASAGDRLLVLGGGARNVLIPLTVAGLAAVDCVSTTLGFSDVDHAVRELALPNLLSIVSDSESDTLASIADVGALSLPDLSERTDHSKSTVTRHVNRLEGAGLVESWMAERTKRVRITTVGRLLIE